MGQGKLPSHGPSPANPAVRKCMTVSRLIGTILIDNFMGTGKDTPNWAFPRKLWCHQQIVLSQKHVSASKIGKKKQQPRIYQGCPPLTTICLATVRSYNGAENSNLQSVLVLMTVVASQQLHDQNSGNRQTFMMVIASWVHMISISNFPNELLTSKIMREARFA